MALGAPIMLRDVMRLTKGECNKSPIVSSSKTKIKGNEVPSTIKKLQEERGSIYGKFEAQCKCVGQIMEALEDCATENNKMPTPQQKGAFVYMAIKLARYAVNPEHKDTLVDLESYANLIKTMESE